MSDEKPSCFQKHWDPNDVVCKGGLDPAYTDEDGGHKRDRCIYFSPCGVRVQANKISSNTLVSAQSLTRDRQESPRPYVHTYQSQEPEVKSVSMQVPAVVYLDQHGRQITQQQYTQIVEQVAQMQRAQQQQIQYPTYIPPQPRNQAQSMPVNYEMPTYLTVPEERHEGEGIMPVVSRTVARGMFKGAAHALAHLIDITQFRRK